MKVGLDVWTFISDIKDKSKAIVYCTLEVFEGITMAPQRDDMLPPPPPPTKNADCICSLFNMTNRYCRFAKVL